jgi:hypothetical protein
LANVGGVGEWNNNLQFAPFHTQSTRRYSDECFSSGGLDDRFDFILMSDEIYMGFNKIKYLNNSFIAVGNDGQHFDQSIDQNGNDAVPPVVAEALFDGSDHLPVAMKLSVFAQLDVDEHLGERFMVYPNPAGDQINVTVNGDYRITNVFGQTVMTGQESQSIDVSCLASGVYFLNVDGIIRKFIKK